MPKLSNKDKMASTNIHSEEFIAEVTNPNLQYKLAGSIVVTEDLTDEELQKHVDEIFAKMWQA